MSLFSSESNRSGKPPSPRFTLPPASPPQARHRSGYSRLASISANSLANIPLEERDESTARLEGITLEPGLAANDMRPTTRAANDLDPEFHDFSEVSAFGARSPPDRYTPLSSRSLNSDASSANLLKHPLSYHKAKNSNLDSGVSLKSYKSYAGEYCSLRCHSELTKPQNSLHAKIALQRDHYGTPADTICRLRCLFFRSSRPSFLGFIWPLP